MCGKIWQPRDLQFLKNGKCGASIRNCFKQPQVLLTKIIVRITGVAETFAKLPELYRLLTATQDRLR